MSPNGPKFVPQSSRKGDKQGTEGNKPFLPTASGVRILRFGAMSERVALAQKVRHDDKSKPETISVGFKEPTKGQAEGVIMSRKELIQHCNRLVSLNKTIEDNVKSIVEHNKDLEEIRDGLQKMLERNEKFHGIKIK